MLNTIKLFLLGRLSESLDDIIALFEKVDARLDRYLDQERGKQLTLQVDIAKLEEKLIQAKAAGRLPKIVILSLPFFRGP